MRNERVKKIGNGISKAKLFKIKEKEELHITCSKI